MNVSDNRCYVLSFCSWIDAIVFLNWWYECQSLINYYIKDPFFNSLQHYLPRLKPIYSAETAALQWRPSFTSTDNRRMCRVAGRRDLVCWCPGMSARLRPKLRPVCMVSVFTSTSVTIHGVLYLWFLPNAFLVVSLNQIVELFKILSWHMVTLCKFTSKIEED